jgi:dihydrodipicolinate synthase/N-acetylneuraminate lyase
MCVFCGCDTLALESLLLGTVGWVGGVVNVLPSEHVRWFELTFRDGDLFRAHELYYRLLPTLSRMDGGGKYTQFVKAGCELTGHPVGPPRKPLLPATPDKIESLRQMLSEPVIAPVQVCDHCEATWDNESEDTRRDQRRPRRSDRSHQFDFYDGLVTVGMPN